MGVTKAIFMHDKSVNIEKIVRLSQTL